MARSGPFSIVGWLAADGDADELAGAAFLIGSEIAITCAHVVRDHLGLGKSTPVGVPGDRVLIRFEALGSEIGGHILADGWFPDSTTMDEEGISDVAIICLDEAIEGVTVPAIARAMPNQRFDALVFGAGPGYQLIGQHAQVKISGSANLKGWRSLDSAPEGFAVKRGFSGAPAMDELGNTVWGMIAAVDADGERVSFAIPADDLHLALRRVGAAAGVRIEDDADVDAREAMIALTGQIDGMKLEAQHKEEELARLREMVRSLEQRERGTEGDGPERAALQSLAGGDTQPAAELLRERIGQQRAEAAAAARQLGSLLSLSDSAGALLAYREAAVLDPDDFWTLIELGDRERRAGSLTRAAEAYRRANDLAARKTAKDPDDTEWQRNLFVCYERIGGVREAQGDLPGALDAFNKGLAISTRLIALDPHSTQRQRDQMIGHNKIGNVRQALRNLSGALDAYNEGLTISARFAAADPHNTEWQRDLSVSHSKIGEVLQAQGDLPGALDAYTKDLAIAARLAAIDPSNAEWQRDLAVSHCKIGEVREAQDDLPGALDAYRKDLEIAAGLASIDPYNTEWQRDLSVSHENIGEVCLKQDDFAGALDAYNKCLEIRDRLAAIDPHNTVWQRDLSVSHERIGDVYRAQGNRAGALEAYKDARAIRARLAKHDPSNAEWKQDLALIRARISGLGKKTLAASAASHRRA